MQQRRPCTHGRLLRSETVGALRMTEAHYPPGAAVPPHEHEGAGFMVVLEGSMRETFSRRALDAGAGHVVLKPPDARHADLAGSAGARCLVFEVRSAHAALQAARHLTDRVEVLAAPALGALARRIDRELSAWDELSPLAVEGLALELVAAAGRTSSPPRAPPAWSRRVAEMLADELSAPPGLADVARRLGVDETHVAREFRRAHGCSLGEFVRAARAARASELLAKTDAPIAQIALDVGYSDQSHFSRAFARQMGESPGRYRRAKRATGRR